MKKVETQEELDQIMSSNEKVLIDIYSNGCGPCEQMLPLIEKFDNENEDWFACKINFSETPELVFPFRVRNVPTFLFVQNGEVKSKVVGSVPYNRLVEESGALTA